ncbi:hypothetical protein GGR57DRAFT_502379 [Xylariaceae sp. FL1272]|nr:hypothetical protein GGR57DRAFT_502379 [Xylariaceae sp. FL1272]
MTTTNSRNAQIGIASLSIPHISKAPDRHQIATLPLPKAILYVMPFSPTNDTRANSYPEPSKWTRYWADKWYLAPAVVASLSVLPAGLMLHPSPLIRSYAELLVNDPNTHWAGTFRKTLNGLEEHYRQRGCIPPRKRGTTPWAQSRMVTPHIMRDCLRLSLGLFIVCGMYGKHCQRDCKRWDQQMAPRTRPDVHGGSLGGSSW